MEAFRVLVALTSGSVLACAGYSLSLVPYRVYEMVLWFPGGPLAFHSWGTSAFWARLGRVFYRQGEGDQKLASVPDSGCVLGRSKEDLD